MFCGPQTPYGEAIDAMKHRLPGETHRDKCNRLASALSDNPNHYDAFRQILLYKRFLAGGRIQSNIGSTRFTTPYNCFVSGTIADSFVDGPGSIMARATEAAQTMRMGGGIGYDFSPLRPRGTLIGRLGSSSSGPVPFMRIFDGVCLATSSAGDRRGAQMGILRIDHPDIEEFIHAKNDNHTLRGFNLSVAVTDEFMRCLSTERPFALRWGGSTYREVDPLALWNTIMRSTHDWAEPGVIFIDTINRMNNLWYCETIAATNPCSEQPLPPYGACLLGSFNLPAYIRQHENSWYFDYGQLIADIPHVVRAMDNVIDIARYPLPEQRREAQMKRRMGLGVTGLANAIERLGAPYGSPEFVTIENDILACITRHSYRASAELASEKGVFECYNNRYLSGEFFRTLDPETQDLIRYHGIRNSHLTSIAPTGTISMGADNVSSGIEPVFSFAVDRPVEGLGLITVEDYGSRFFDTRGRTASEVTVDEHLAVLLAAQRHIDSAVSKTINMDSAKMSWEEFKDIYSRAWQGGAKGVSTFNISGSRSALLTETAVGATCEIDPVTGRKNCE